MKTEREQAADDLLAELDSMLPMQCRNTCNGAALNDLYARLEAERLGDIVNRFHKAVASAVLSHLAQERGQ